MNLDLRTMMVMISALSLLFAGLLSLAGLHSGGIRGVKQWACGSLLIGLCLALSYTQLEPPAEPWVLLAGSAMMLAGVGFQFNGIQAFKTGTYTRPIPWLLAGLAAGQTFWFTVVQPDIHTRAIANSLLLFAINLACARALFVNAEQPLKTAYWLTGASFILLAAMFLARAIVIFFAPAGSYGLYVQIPLNPVLFFISSLTQMSITFGFVLMLNYRLASGHQKLAATDALTGVMNRRSLEQEATRLLARCAHGGKSLAVMMIDVDHFKSINDLHGHVVGDEMLRHLTRIARKSIRSADCLARYGGEEFCILLPDSLEQEAWLLGERLRLSFASSALKLDDKMLYATISVGIADSNRIGLSLNDLIVAADQAMYKAKQSGRNRVVLHSKSNPA